MSDQSTLRRISRHSAPRRLSDEELIELERIASAQGLESPEAAIRAVLSTVLREQAIVESYRRAYATVPEDPLPGEIGARLLARHVGEDRGAA